MRAVRMSSQYCFKSAKECIKKFPYNFYKDNGDAHDRCMLNDGE